MLVAVACGSETIEANSVVDAGPGAESGTDAASDTQVEPDRPDGWSEESHGKVSPNYDRLFTDGTVHQVNIKVTPEDYEATMV